MRVYCAVFVCLCLLFIIFCGRKTDEGQQMRRVPNSNFRTKEVKFKMKFSEKGVSLLKEIEGFEPEPYLDSKGCATIGYGHKIKRGELFTRITEKEADLLLRKDVEPIEKFINVHLKTLVTQNQFDALVMFIYNIGETAFLNSNVFQDLKERKYDEAIKPWAKWINVSKQVKDEQTGEMVKKLFPVQGLINRRAKEIQLFNA